MISNHDFKSIDFQSFPTLIIAKTFIMLNGNIQQRIKLGELLYVNQPQHNIVF